MSSVSEATAAVSANSAETAYESRLAALRSSLAETQQRTARASSFLWLAAVALVASLFYTGSFHIAPVAALPVAAMAFALRPLIRSRFAALDLALRCGFYERGLQRIQYDWSSLTATGDEFSRPGHIYQSDLQILGPRSLFSLLCTTRSQAGAARLAAFLLDPASPEEIQARQHAVQELRPSVALREEVSLLGKYQFQECDPAILREWMSTPILRAHPLLRLVLALNGAASLLILLAPFGSPFTWAQTLPILFPCLALQAALSALWINQIRPRLPLLRTLTNEFTVLRSGLALLERQSFSSPKLQTLTAQIRGAARRVRALERLLTLISVTNKDIFVFFGILVAAGTQLTLAIDRWRATHQQSLESWLDAWAEFEALSALAGYAFEHPGDVFPEFVESALFEADNLGHPLLTPGACVRNSLALGPNTRFLVVSGSNMAGKSTWLKTIGINAVLASAGAPLRATSARLAHFTIGASSSVGDSLLDGKSRFLAEAERIRAILALTTGPRPVLFLIDEILSGTNSLDRRLACTPIVRSLLHGGAVGVLSTHDLALTEIADIPQLHGLNVCMESPDPADPLRFDYRVRPGITRTSSARAILALMDIPTGPSLHAPPAP